MKILLIHQNFPGQYLHLAQHLRNIGGHEIVGLGEAKNIKARGVIKGITTIGYPTPEGAGAKTHPYLHTTESSIRRGQAVARSMLDLKKKGFIPDVVCVHPGWGEGLFVRDVFPDAAIQAFCEFYFRAGEADLEFDPEFPEPPSRMYSISFLNMPQIMTLINANACLSPTHWQASRYPEFLQNKMDIVHDGVDTEFMQPEPDAELALIPLQTPGESRIFGYNLPNTLPSLMRPQGKQEETQRKKDEHADTNQCKPGNITCTLELKEGELPASNHIVLTRRDKVITYIGRNLEPYRGFHIFMRALPEIQRLHPDAHVIIVGRDGVSYSPKLADGQTYKARYLKELEGKLDLSRIHFVGRIPYPALRAMYCVSTAHVYLTYPFVLSWSMLEAMSCESLVVGSRTEPVEEVITHGKNSLLVDFFDKDGLVSALDDVLKAPHKYESMRRQARKTVTQRYELKDCLTQQVEIIQDLADGKYPVPR